MTMYVYQIKSNSNSTDWDEAIHIGDTEIVAIINADTNAECEAKASDNGYSDSDQYGYTYTDDMDYADIITTL